ncbi:MAG: GIY-YIG nuclease family protein [Immundisolibacteraceae bacterium]|nr:GIY-YIG nuclease family protein [Immundisolibacteraceae bacterium]
MVALTDDSPAAPGDGSVGCYLLRLNLPAAATIEVGRAGRRQFMAGAYLYVGSAFGPGGVRGRLAHHLRLSARPHWHIDYLRHHAEIDEIWFAETDRRLERRWADGVKAMTACQPMVPGLGASDCDCETHLFYFESPPELPRFIAALDQTGGGPGPINHRRDGQPNYQLQRWQPLF